MITFRELMQDEVFRKWMAKPPKLQSRWRVFVQKEEGGRWGKADFDTYADAYRFMAKNLKKYHDMSIHCLARLSDPPIVVRKTGRVVKGIPERTRKSWMLTTKLDLAGHRWCGLCRRPVKFRYFTRHHAIPSKYPINGYEKLCSICGGREVFVS